VGGILDRSEVLRGVLVEPQGIEERLKGSLAREESLAVVVGRLTKRGGEGEDGRERDGKGGMGVREGREREEREGE